MITPGLTITSLKQDWHDTIGAWVADHPEPTDGDVANLVEYLYSDMVALFVDCLDSGETDRIKARL